MGKNQLKHIVDSVIKDGNFPVYVIESVENNGQIHICRKPYKRVFGRKRKNGKQG